MNLKPIPNPPEGEACPFNAEAYAIAERFSPCEALEVALRLVIVATQAAAGDGELPEGLNRIGGDVCTAIDNYRQLLAAHLGSPGAGARAS